MQDPKCIAVLVAYNPDEGFEGRLRDLIPQVYKVLIVNNGNKLALPDNLIDSLLLINNSENLGVAKALNQGIQLADELGATWVVTLDQDSELVDGFVSRMMAVYEILPIKKSLLGANFFDSRRGRLRERTTELRPGYVPKKTVITSGMMFPISLFRELGGFREEYFIDSVDHEYCLRARKAGYGCYITCEPLMTHCIGTELNASLQRFLPCAYNHPPFRKYYIARNVVLTVKEYFAFDPAWVAKQFLRVIWEFLSIVAFEENKLEKLRSFNRGIIHGIRWGAGNNARARDVNSR